MRPQQTEFIAVALAVWCVTTRKLKERQTHCRHPGTPMAGELPPIVTDGTPSFHLESQVFPSRWPSGSLVCISFEPSLQTRTCCKPPRLKNLAQPPRCADFIPVLSSWCAGNVGQWPAKGFSLKTSYSVNTRVIVGLRYSPLTYCSLNI